MYNFFSFNIGKKFIKIILFLILFRIGSFIPIYNIKMSFIVNKFIDFNDHPILKIYNLFSGGSLVKFSIFSMGMMPYISSTILIQFLSNTVPYFIKLKNDFNSKNIYNLYIYIFTFIISIINSFITLLSINRIFNIIDINIISFIFSMISLISGTFILIWLSNKITDIGIGNGGSIMVFIGIINNLPTYVTKIIKKIFNNSIKFEIILLILILIILYILIYAITFIECSQRKIIINYPKQYIFNKNFTNIFSPSYLPIKINISGIMPISFSSTLITFFRMLIYNIYIYTKFNIFNLILLFLKSGTLSYIIIYAILIFIFNYAYSFISFNISNTSNNLKKSGILIPGIRPGINTEIYLSKIINNLIFISFLYIFFIYIITEMLNKINLINVSGSSLLIVVVISIEIINQLQNNLISNKYSLILKKLNLDY
ncbi:protein translocase subunit SecY [endosymbiont of Euscepes postfasciatus]|uniref:preprotein translocase subunit SecY n=1 Tax=endosymbiont of Euscepes postfasciatus TaxID=650377 RepID=UPI000DC70DFD|nr:hypothetical protein [endosymbiont of Euscepes postfasciatus]BBA84674.1 protein translocase subunit SecY [endosymbiont of Euscepes postfasciatus]